MSARGCVTRGLLAMCLRLFGYATPREQIALFQQVDALLATLAERTARIVIAGPLNDEQQANVRFLLTTLDGLRALFRAEALRTGCGNTNASGV